MEENKILEKEVHACENILVEPVEGINELYSQPTRIPSDNFICTKEEEVLSIKFDPMLLECNNT